MSLVVAGGLQKMAASLSESGVEYQWRAGEERMPLNQCLGKTIKLQALGAIHCQHCGRKTRKSYSQGYCYPCFTKLPQCDLCIVSPEKCHFSEGTCRDASWGEQFCFAPHIVYLANSSGAKVGITRTSQMPTRWIDQGAIQALPIMRVATRQQAGLVEALLRENIADKTNWRAMLKGDVAPIDLLALRDQLLEQFAAPLAELKAQQGELSINASDADNILEINYPVLQYPTKVVALNLDKTPTVEGQLLGIKGQYLILDTGVINIRKYTSYHVEFSAF